jgi:hypothetical protein
MDGVWLIGVTVGVASASPPVIAVGIEVWEYVRPYFIPQSEIDALARDCVTNFGARTMDELLTLAGRARLRGETAEEGTIARVILAVRRIEGDA